MLECAGAGVETGRGRCPRGPAGDAGRGRRVGDIGPGERAVGEVVVYAAGDDGFRSMGDGTGGNIRLIFVSKLSGRGFFESGDM